MAVLHTADVIDRLRKPNANPTPFANDELIDIDLSFMTFSKPANFDRAKFSGEARFVGTLFRRGASFRSAQFNDFADFDFARFRRKLQNVRGLSDDPGKIVDAEDSDDSLASSDAESTPERTGEDLKADFTKCSFRGGANFRRVRFDIPVFFTDATIVGQAYFWKCRFKDAADFAHLSVEKEQQVEAAVPVSGEQLTQADKRVLTRPKRHPGEANFSYSIFHRYVDFTRSHFFGISYFHRTVFFGGGSFGSSLFDEGVWFEGESSDVCVSIYELSLALADTEENFCRQHNISNAEYERAIFNAEAELMEVLDRFATSLKGTESPILFDLHRMEEVRGRQNWTKLTGRRGRQVDRVLTGCSECLSSEQYRARLLGFCEDIFIRALADFGPGDEPSATALGLPGTTVTANAGQIAALKNASVLLDNQDNRGDFFNFDAGIRTVAALKDRLSAVPGFTPDQVRRLIALWEQYSYPYMFLEKFYFDGVVFEQRDKVTFNNIDMRSCEFLQCKLEGVHFANISWDKQPKLLLFSPRFALGTERRHRKLWAELRHRVRGRKRTDNARSLTRSEFEEMAELYHDLKITYAHQGLMLEATDFYFGEMQMVRLALGRPRCWLSLSFAYRLLSGYGRQEGLALGWLCAWVFLIFPLSYMALDLNRPGFWVSVLHSLRISTFLRDVSAGGGAAPPAYSSFAEVLPGILEGIERIVVAAQAGLFILSARAKFDPTRY